VSALRRSRAIFFTLAILIAALDQVTKAWVKLNLDIGESILNIGFFRISPTYNTGASFGIFQGQNVLFAVINLAGLAAILYFVLFRYRQLKILGQTPVIVSLGLISGGIIGNLTDRLTSGRVTDFIDFTFWPAFNVADSAIVLGAILLGFIIILQTWNDRPSPDGEKT